MKMSVGTLVLMRINVHMIDGSNVCIGDIGIIVQNELIEEEHYFTNFDYLLVVNGRDLYVFEDEIEPYA